MKRVLFVETDSELSDSASDRAATEFYTRNKRVESSAAVLVLSDN